MLCVISVHTLLMQATCGGAQCIGHQQVLQPHQDQALSHSLVLDRKGGELQVTSTKGRSM